MDNTHAQGPRHVVGNDDTGFWEVHDEHSCVIGRIESESEARLIAAAPGLLRSLQRLVHPMASEDDVEYARDVIAKATGEDNG